MKAVSICFKPFLKPEEALIYCNLGRTQFKKRTEEHGIFKTKNGYYRKEDLDKMLSGEVSPIIETAKKFGIGKNIERAS